MNLRELTEAFAASLPELSDEAIKEKENLLSAVLRRKDQLSPGYQRAAREALVAIAKERLRRAFL